VSPRPFVAGKFTLPPEYAGYARDPKAPIESPVPKDRLSIPKGQPGYVPEFQRAGLSTTKPRRVRRYGETKNGVRRGGRTRRTTPYSSAL